MTKTDSSNYKLESDAIALFDQDVNPEQCTLKPDAKIKSIQVTLFL